MSRSWMHGVVFSLLTIASAMGGVAPASKAPPAEAHVVAEIERRFGKRVPRAQAPGSYGMIDAVIDRLSPAAESILRESYGRKLPLNVEVTVLKKADPNAFVVEVMGPNRVRKTQIYVTEGMLDLLMSEAKKSAVVAEQGRFVSEALAGLLSHELAHLVDTHDPNGIEASYVKGSDISPQQAIEMRTDIEAQQILRRAELPMESEHRVLRILAKYETHWGGTVEIALAGISTHPQTEMRLTATSGAVTLYERKYGEAPQRPIQLDSQTFGSFVQERTASLVSKEVKVPQKLEELLPWFHLGTVDDKINRSAYLSNLVEALEGHTGGFTATERKALQNFFIGSLTDTHLSWGSPNINPSEELGASLWARWEKVRDRVAMEVTDQRFQLRLKRATQTILQKSPEAQLFFAEAARRYLPPKLSEPIVTRVVESMVEGFSKQIPQLQPTLTSAKAMKSWLAFDGVANSEVYERWMVKVHEKVLSQLPDQDWAKLFLIPDHSENSLWTFRILESHMLSDRLSDPKALKAYRKVAQSLWSRREVLSAIDLADPSGVGIDWDSIWKVLEISPQEGRKELNAAFKRFATSDRMGPFLDNLPGRGGSDEALRVISWPDDDLAEYVSGEKLRNLTKEQRATAVKKLASRFYQRAENIQEVAFESAFRKRLPKRISDLLISDLDSLIEEVVVNTIGDKESMWSFTREVLMAIDVKYPTSPKKSELLRRLLIQGESQHISQMWFTSFKPTEMSELFDFLKRNELAQSPMELMQVISREGDASLILAATEYFWEPLSNQIRGMKKIDELDAAAQLLLDPTHTQTGAYRGSKRFDAARLKGRRIREIRESFVQSYLKFAESPANAGQLLTSFFHVTANGPTQATDQLFRKVFVQGPLRAKDPKLYNKVVATALESGRIWHPDFQVELARQVVQAEFPELNKLSSAEAILKLKERMEKLAPNMSLARDTWIDEVAWQIPTRDATALEVLDTLKTTHWRTGTAGLVNQSSAFSAFLSDFSPQGKFDALEFLKASGKGEMTDALRKEIRTRAAAQIENLYRDGSLKISSWEKAAQVDDLASSMELALREFAANTKQLEKLPTYQFLLSSGGADALIGHSMWVDQLIGTSLGHSPTSKEFKAIRAYLRAIPEHERAWTLAYLLSQKGSGGSIKPIFEVFKTVGIKAGQLGSLWKVFNEDIQRELGTLRDSATPLTKAEVLAILKEELSPQEFAKIKDVKGVLGSASIKTVVEVEMTDGRHVVALVRSPGAEQQVRSNVKRARAFLKELQAEGMISSRDPLWHLLDEAEGQILAELDFLDEAKKIQRMDAAYAEMMSKTPSRFKGWKVEVPGLVKDFEPRGGVLFLEKAKGTSYAQMKAISEVDGVIADTTLDQFFERGVLNPDPHRGNFLVDVDNKTIYAIDFGQMVSFNQVPNVLEKSDAYLFSQYLRAIGKRDAARIVDTALALNHHTATASQRATLIEEVKQLLAKGVRGEQEVFLDVLKVFSDAKLPFESRYSVGVFKGLLILKEEGYLSEDAYRAAIRERVKGELLRRSQGLLNS